RYVSLIKGKTHSNQVVKLKDTVSISSNNLMGKAIDIVRTGSGISLSGSLEPIALVGLLKGTSAFGSTFRHQAINASTIFTKVVSDVPSVALILSDAEGNLTSLNRVVDQGSIFSRFL